MRGTVGPLGILAALGFALGGCGSDGGLRTNLPPTAELTSGPVDGDTVSYQVDLSWTGSDPDGQVARFEFAIDPPAAFTENEIAQGGPGITAAFHPGAGGDPDTTRVTKTGDEGITRFDWIHTQDTSRTLRFSTPEADSTLSGNRLVPTGRFHGMHAFYLRAIDNHEAASVPAKLAFTATTVAPSARVTRPLIGGRDILILGTTARFEWTGNDPDAAASPLPVGYLYKLCRLDTLPIPIVSPFMDTPDLLYRYGGDWTFVSGDVDGLNLDFSPMGTYLFGIRAVDEAGAVEPFLDFGRNAFEFLSSTSGGKPVLTISEPSVGGFTFRGIASDCPETEVATGARLRFTWSATAQEYGGQIDAYSWGLDIADLDREDPQSGWSAWGNTTGNPTPISFPLPGIHVLYVRVRDVAGAITLGCITLRVIEVQYDREVLYVDDFPDKTTPRPSQHTDFWRGLFQSYADNSDWDVSAFNEFHAWGENDDQFVPSQLTLSEMGRYKLLVWETLGTGVGSVTALVQSATLTPRLGGYLRAGGKLWVSGNATVMAMTTSPNGLTGDPAYPKTSISSGQFIYDFLKIHATRIDNDRGSNNRNTLMGAWPFPTPGKPALYDTLMVDPDKLSPIALGAGRGVSYGDVITDPMFVESEPGFRGNVDSLYVYRAAGPILGTGASIYDWRLNAVRWSDPDPDRLQGRVQWFGFSMYWMFDSQAASVFKKSIDWFREETRETPSP